MDKKKKNVLLIIALVLGILYLIYAAWYWFGGGGPATSTSAERAGATLAKVIVAPHLLLAFLATVFNALALGMSKAGFALTSGILYAAAMLVAPLYFVFTIIQMILCFVAFAKMRKQSDKAA